MKTNALILEQLAKITNYTIGKGFLQILISEEKFLTTREQKI